LADYKLSDMFDVIGLPFDPPEKAPKKIKVAIDKTKKELNESLGTATQQLERDELNKKLRSLDKFFGSDGKLSPDYEEEAKTRTRQEMEKLSATVALLSQSGSRWYTEGTLRIHRQKTKLSKEHVEEIFKAAGFNKSEIDPLKAFPKFPTNAEKTFIELEALRKSKDPNPNAADLTKSTDMYAFTAYLVGEPDNAAEYRSKSTPELASLLDGFAKKFAMRNDDLGKLCASLATAGKSYFFNSEDNRQAYETFLKYKTPNLTQLFSSIGRVSKLDLLDPKFAEGCIKQISAVFGSYDVSLAIYNKEAGLKDEPYIPVTAVFHVKCHHCQNLIEFADITEAQRANKCSHCGQVLYKQCKKCHKNVLVSLDKCPECGFVFVSVAMYTKYFAAAEQALRRGDFESARSSMFQAQSVDPSEKKRTDELAARIDAEEKRYEKPINELRKLIADKMFQKASLAVANISGIDISSFEMQINTLLSQVQAKFENAKKLSPSKRADEYLAILQDCVDFEPAINYLQATSPEPCKNFSVSINTSAGHANISWSRSLELGVNYRLVRKQGKEIPANEKDGEILLNDSKETSYQDKGILPACWYGYAVFAIRYGIFSSATGQVLLLLADVTNARAEQFDKTVRLTWNPPPNCTGITIRRVLNGTETVLTNNAHNSFEDKNIQYGTAYSYKLCANYINLSSSKGVDLVITPMPQINSFSITAKQLKECNYKVSWNINQNGIDLRVLVNEKLVRELKSDAGSCDLELPPDGFHTITIMAFSGGGWLRSENSPQINTYMPCSVDKVASYLHESAITSLQGSAYNLELHLKVGGLIPRNVAGFHYAVKTGASQNRWPGVQDIGKDADIQRIGISAYRKNDEILYTETAREESGYYVSLFTIYDMNGKEVVSNPKPCRFERPLTASVFWKITKSFLGGMKLFIEISGNRPLTRIPELVLCVCSSSQHLLSPTDTKAKQLLKIPEIELGTPQKAYSGSYDVKTDLSTKQLRDIKFFLFEISLVPGEKFSFPWATGFKGKV